MFGVQWPKYSHIHYFQGVLFRLYSESLYKNGQDFLNVQNTDHLEEKKNRCTSEVLYKMGNYPWTLQTLYRYYIKWVTTSLTLQILYSYYKNG